MHILLKGGIVSVVTSVLFCCSAKEAYYVTRGLLGYIPPPEVPTVMAQLKQELRRCERANGVNCEQQAMAYVRLMNKSLERKPLKGTVIITRDYGEVEVEYEPDTLALPAPIQENTPEVKPPKIKTDKDNR